MMLRRAVLGVLSALLLSGCGNEYTCPDPIGRIVRDDCEEYRTRYESLKVQIGFSVGNLGFSVGAGREKLRDPSELLQVLMQQTLALCKDFNSCRVPGQDYRRRREESDRKFTAITAISQQLRADLDGDSKRRLVTKLIEVITAREPSREAAPPSEARRPEGPRFSPGFFRSATSLWFGSKFQPPRPSLPDGVPALARWEVTRSSVGWSASSNVILTLWGKTEVDDRVFIALSQPALQASAAVSPRAGRPEASATFTFRDTWLRGMGTLTVWYRPGATGIKHLIGTVDLDARRRLGEAYLAYLPDPVRMDPIEYERPWLVFFTRLGNEARVTLRCEHNGKPEEAVLSGVSYASPYAPGHVRSHYLPLPVRIPLKGGSARSEWQPTHRGERVPRDRLPAEAAGTWACRASLNGRVARRIEVKLRPDGSVEPSGALGRLAPPWWPVKTLVLPNEVEQERERQLAEVDAREEARQRERQERHRER